jgi:hypothetical protein
LTLTNSKENQKTIMLKIYQGDSDIAAENELLGTFVFSGIRQMPRGKVKVDVWLNIDSEGILSLSAKDKSTGHPVDVHLKLKNRSRQATLALHTETRGGQLMSQAAAEKKAIEAERKAKAEAKSVGEVNGAERTADFGNIDSPPPAPNPAARGSKEATPASPPVMRRAPRQAPPAPVAAPAARKRGKGIKVTAPPTAPQVEPPKVAPAAEPPKPVVPKAEPPRPVQAAPRVAPPEVKPVEPAARPVEPASTLPEKTWGPDTPAPAIIEDPGCLAMLLPWNWFR